MNKERHQRICPAGFAVGLDNSIRRLFQDPQKILKPYIYEGMMVLDLGCGPGFFTIEIAKMLKDSGKVIAADLQEGMLEKIAGKINGTKLEQRITLHKCREESIGIAEAVDFILAFWMIHEVPGQDNLFRELKSVLKPNGRIFIVEPKFHVSHKSFEQMVSRINSAGFEIIERPGVFASRAVLLTIPAF